MFKGYIEKTELPDSAKLADYRDILLDKDGKRTIVQYGTQFLNNTPLLLVFHENDRIEILSAEGLETVHDMVTKYFTKPENHGNDYPYVYEIIYHGFDISYTIVNNYNDWENKI